jgi:hypothetical protein
VVGEESKAPVGPIQRFAFPGQVTLDQPGREVEKLMVDMGYVPSQPSRERKYRGISVRLSDELYSQYQDSMRKAADRVRRKIRSTRLLQLEEDEQRKVVKRIYDEEKDRAYGRIKRSIAFLKLYRAAVSAAQEEAGGG